MCLCQNWNLKPQSPNFRNQELLGCEELFSVLRVHQPIIAETYIRSEKGHKSRGIYFISSLKVYVMKCVREKECVLFTDCVTEISNIQYTSPVVRAVKLLTATEFNSRWASVLSFEATQLSGTARRWQTMVLMTYSLGYQIRSPAIAQRLPLLRRVDAPTIP
jgi:hypothetical protein